MRLFGRCRFAIPCRQIYGSARKLSRRAAQANARATPETFELAIPFKVASASERLIERKGRKTWRVTVPANGEAKLNFALKLEVKGEGRGED